MIRDGWAWLVRQRTGYSVDIALLLCAVVALCGPYLLPIYRSAIPGGWDGVPHYAIADLYARHIYPSLHGWLPEYFMGMPFPNFYPPVFYFLVATLVWLGLSTKAAFLTVQTLALAAVPVLTYLCARRLSSSRIGGLVAGMVAIGYLIGRSPLTRFGIALEGTFETGLATQLLGHVFLLLFGFALLHAHKSRASAAGAAVWFGLVPLTNINTVWPAAILFVAVVIARLSSARTNRERLAILGRHTAIGAAAVLISACWVLPMLAHLAYVPTLATKSLPAGAVAFTFFRLAGYLILALAAAAYMRDPIALALVATSAILAGFGVFPFGNYPLLRDLPIQPGRHAIVVPFLMPVLIGYVVVIAGHAFQRTGVRALLGAVCVAVFFLHITPACTPATLVTHQEMADYRRVIDALDGRTDGRVLAQVGEKGFSDGFAMQALLGAAGAASLTTVFRESAINVLVAVPLRNSMAGQGEEFGVDAKLDADRLARADSSQVLARLRLLNIKYLAVQHEEMKQRIAVLPGLRRISPEGRWELYTFDAPEQGYAVVPNALPVLTFAPFSVKRRAEDGLDFMRLGEEMFAAGALDVPLVRSRFGKIDHERDWDRFAVALVTELDYDNRDQALAALERFSRDRHLVVVGGSDPLHADIARLAAERSTVHIITRPSASDIAAMASRLGGSDTDTSPAGRSRWAVAMRDARRHAVQTVCERILAILAEVSEPLPGGVAEVASAVIERDVVRVRLDRPPGAPVPVWIRHSFFPSWENPSGEPIYMATPGFQLTFTQEPEVVLRYRQSGLYSLGAALSLLGLLLVAVLWRGLWQGSAAAAVAVFWIASIAVPARASAHREPETGLEGKADGRIDRGSLSHVPWQDRVPRCPVAGEAFEVRFQALAGDLTAARVGLVAVSAKAEPIQWLPATRVAVSGAYDVFSARVPPTDERSAFRYLIEVKDGADTAYYSAGGVAETLPDSGFVIDFATLEHAPVGATPASGGVVFKVWAPNATHVTVPGAFNRWDPTAHPMRKVGEHFIAFIPGVAAGQPYKFHFSGTVWNTDPRGRRLDPTDHWNALVVAQPERLRAFRPPALAELVIYQLHVGTFAGRSDPAGKTTHPSRFADVAARIDHLTELGINAVLLNPVTEFSGPVSGGYNPVTQWAPSSKYGTPEELLHLIDAFHEAGIAVLLDIVWNHISPTDNFLWKYDGTQTYFDTPPVETPWGVQLDLDAPAVQAYFLESALMWLGEYGVDGFRVDATRHLYRPPHSAAGFSLMQRLNDWGDRRYRDRVLIAEELPSDPALTRPTEFRGAGFDLQYHSELKLALRAAVIEAAFGDPSMASLRRGIEGAQVAPQQYLNYVQLHDEAWPQNGGRRLVGLIDPSPPHDDIYAMGRMMLAQGLVMTAPGVPAMLMGDEWLEDTDFGPDEPNRIDWAKKQRYSRMFAFTRDLIAVRRSQPALRADARAQVTGLDEAGNVLAFVRGSAGSPGGQVLAIANFSNHTYAAYRVGVPTPGRWHVILHSQDPRYGGSGPTLAILHTEARPAHGLASSVVLPLAPMALVVLAQEPLATRAGMQPETPAPCAGAPPAVCAFGAWLVRAASRLLAAIPGALSR